MLQIYASEKYLFTHIAVVLPARWIRHLKMQGAMKSHVWAAV